MLDFNICEKCHNEFDRDKLFHCYGDRIVYCPKLKEENTKKRVSLANNWVEKADLPPDCCPFRMEHIIATGDTQGQPKVFYIQKRTI